MYLCISSVEIQNFGTDEFVTDITKLATKVLGAVTPVEYLLLAIASPIIYSFAVDSDGVNDNNGVIEGYGTVSAKENVSNIFDRIVDLISTAIKYISMFFSIIIKIVIH